MIGLSILKKTAVAGFLGFLCSVNVFAGNPVSVKSGKASVLRTPAKVILEIDYSATRVGKQTLAEYHQERGEDFVRDWPREQETAASHFRNEFKKRSKGLQMTTDESVASYKMLIKVKSLDMGNAGSFFVTMALGGSRKAGGVIMVGTVEIIDLNTNAVVCTLYVDEVKGKGNPSEGTRIGLMYADLAKRISKIK